MKSQTTFVLRLLCRAVMVFGFMMPILAGCSHGPKLGGDSTLESLNGQNYQAPISMSAGDIGIRTGGAHTTIRGELVINSGMSIPEPLKYQKLLLLQDQKQIASARSDAGGTFTFTGDIPNGLYTITLDSARYAVSQKLQVTKYKIEGVKVFAREK